MQEVIFLVFSALIYPFLYLIYISRHWQCRCCADKRTKLHNCFVGWLKSIVVWWGLILKKSHIIITAKWISYIISVLCFVWQDKSPSTELNHLKKLRHWLDTAFLSSKAIWSVIIVNNKINLWYDSNTHFTCFYIYKKLLLRLIWQS